MDLGGNLMFTKNILKTSLLAASLTLAFSQVPAAHAGGLTSMVKGVFTATGDVIKGTGDVVRGTARATGDVVKGTAKVTGDAVKGTARAGGAACAATGRAVGTTGRAVGTTASAVAGATGEALAGSAKAVGNTTSAAAGAINRSGDLLGMHHKNKFAPSATSSDAPAIQSEATSTEGTRIQAPVQEIEEISQPQARAQAVPLRQTEPQAQPQALPPVSNESPSWNDSPSWNEQQPRTSAAAFSNQYGLRTTPLKASSH